MQREPSVKQIRAQRQDSLRAQVVALRQQRDQMTRALKHAVGLQSAELQEQLVFVEDRLRRLQRERAELSA